MGRRKGPFRQLNSPLTYLSAKILFSDRFIHSLHLPFFRASSSTNEKAPFSVRVGLPEAAATVMVAVGSPLARPRLPYHSGPLTLALPPTSPIRATASCSCDVTRGKCAGARPPSSPVLYPAVRPTCKWPMMPGMRQRWATRTWRSCRDPPLRPQSSPHFTCPPPRSIRRL